MEHKYLQCVYHVWDGKLCKWSNLVARAEKMIGAIASCCMHTHAFD